MYLISHKQDSFGLKNYKMPRQYFSKEKDLSLIKVKPTKNTNYFEEI